MKTRYVGIYFDKNGDHDGTSVGEKISDVSEATIIIKVNFKTNPVKKIKVDAEVTV
jgi:hypothetical protein